MALVEIKADPALLTRLIVALERLADGLDRFIPPILMRGNFRPAKPSSLHVITNEDQWEHEQEQDRRRDLGLLPEEPEPVEEPEDAV